MSEYATDHEKFDALSVDYIDGRLSSSDRNWMEAHLSLCPECRKKLDELRFMLDESAGLDEEPPEGFDEFIMTRIEMEKTRRQSARITFLRPLIGAAACFALIAVGALILLPTMNQKSADSAAEETTQAERSLSFFSGDTKSMASYEYTEGTEEAVCEADAPQDDLIGYICEQFTERPGGIIWAGENNDSFSFDELRLTELDREEALEKLKNGDFGEGAHLFTESDAFDENSKTIILAVLP